LWLGALRSQGLPISPNVLNREFTASEPDEVWVGEITYIATDERRVFLAVVIDLFRRQVVGWSLREDMTRTSGKAGRAGLPQRRG